MTFAVGLRRLLSAIGLVLVFAADGASAQSRMALIRDKGHVTCGVLPRIPGFADISVDGNFVGFEPDLCRALAAAILGDAKRVQFVLAPNVQDFKRNDDIDLVIRRLTWTMSREADLGLLFGPVVFYDGAGFLVPLASTAAAPRDLSGQLICVRAGSETEESLNEYVAAEGITLRAVARPSAPAATEGLLSGACAALAGDVSELAAVRAQHSGYRLLPQMISKEPLAPLMRQDDVRFFLVVRWTIHVLMAAEELGVTSANVAAQAAAGLPAVRRLLGVNAAALGLAAGWSGKVLAAVGNYGEIFDRNLGQHSPIKLERGINRPWTEGGLIYVPPVR